MKQLKLESAVHEHRSAAGQVFPAAIKLSSTLYQCFWISPKLLLGGILQTLLVKCCSSKAAGKSLVEESLSAAVLKRWGMGFWLTRCLQLSSTSTWWLPLVVGRCACSEGLFSFYTQPNSVISERRRQ